MAKVIVERLSNEEAIKMYGRSMSFVGGNTSKDLQRLGQHNKEKQSNDYKNSVTKKDKDSKSEQPNKSGYPKILASIPKKEGESKEEFAKRFIDKLSKL